MYDGNHKVIFEAFMEKTGYPTLGELGLGKGSINEGFVLTDDKREIFERIASGEFDVEYPDTVASICIDERFTADGTRPPLPRTAGGPAGVAHAVDLVNENGSESEVDVVKDVTSLLVDVEPGVCVHGDNHSECGCGETNKTREIQEELVENIANIVNIPNAALGYQITQSEAGLYVANATSRLENSDFFADPRKDATNAGVEAGAGNEMLVGPHDGEFIIWSRDRKGPDVQKIFEATGLKGFIVHEWSFGKTAEALSRDVETTKKILTVWNLATASVLCSADMPVIIK